MYFSVMEVFLFVEKKREIHRVKECCMYSCDLCVINDRVVVKGKRGKEFHIILEYI